MTRQILQLLACLLVASHVQASDVFDETLSSVDTQVKELVAAEREKSLKSDAKMRAELQAQYNAQTAELAETYRREVAKQDARSADLKGLPSQVLAPSEAADRAMRRAALTSEVERHRNEWFYSALAVLAIAAAGFILFVEVLGRVRGNRSRH